MPYTQPYPEKPEGYFYYGPEDAAASNQPITLNDIAGQGYGAQPEQPTSALPTAIQKLLGLNDQPRYQTWPEKMVRDAFAAPGNAVNTTGLRREDFTDIPAPQGPTADSTWLGKTLGIAPVASQPIDSEIEGAQSMANLAMGGGLPFAGKGAVGMTGGKLIQPAVESTAPTAPKFYSAVENAVMNSKQTTATPEQWMGTIQNTPGVKAEEVNWLGLPDFMQGKKTVSKADLQNYIDAHKVDLNEVQKGEMKFNENSKYNLPEVKNAIKDATGTPGDLALTLANDGAAYKALTKKFPELREDEDWAYKVADDFYGGDTMPKGTTKFSQYQLPGGENYREMLMTLPQGKRFWIDAPFQSPHWDEPNVLAHVRMNDRMIDGKKSLHLEEIQSDWHQKGRAQGYDNPAERAKDLTELPEGYRVVEHAPLKGDDNFPTYSVYAPNGDRVAVPSYNRESAINSVLNNLNETARMQDGKVGSPVPDAPFKKTWHELALKRMIREAAEKGYDRLSWTPGEAQAARYDLSKQVDAIHAFKKADGTFDLHAIPLGKTISDNVALGGGIPAEKLSDYVGKDLAKKIAEQPIGEHKYNDVDLKVGGEGMKGFYDKMIPNALEKLGKSHGVKVKEGNLNSELVRAGKELAEFESQFKSKPIPREMKDQHEYLRDVVAKAKNDSKPEPVHYIDIPQSMKDTAMRKGFPLFSGGHMLIPVQGNPFENDKKPRIVGKHFLVPVSHTPEFAQ